MNDFNPSSGSEITEAIKGKTVLKVDRCNGDAWEPDFLLFRFDDGSALRIEYDWLYEWELVAPNKIPDTLLGLPVIESDDLPKIKEGDIILGDFSRWTGDEE